MKKLILMAAVVLLQPVPAMAVLVYLHSFDDLTDIVDTSTGTSSVGVSSDFAVDGSNSLRFDIVGTKKAIMLLTPQIGGGNNTDDTVTMVSRYRTETAVDDYMQMQVNNDFNILTVRGYPAGGNIGVENAGTLTDTGAAWPVTDWFTIALSIDAVTDQYQVYAKAGTSVDSSDLVGTFDSAGSVTPVSWLFNSTGGGDPDFYIDQFEIFSNLNEFVVPEPATTVLLGIGLVGGLCAVGGGVDVGNCVSATSRYWEPDGLRGRPRRPLCS